MSTTLIKIQKIALSCAGAFALISAPASAALVTKWSYTTDAKFIDATYEAGVGSGVGFTATSDYELSWGSASGNFQSPGANAGANRSALTIGSGLTGDDRIGGGAVGGEVFTTIGGLPDPSAGEIGLGVSFSHWNNPISDTFNTLLSGTVEDILTLTPLEPTSGLSQSAPVVRFDFRFSETPNAGPCAGGTATPCGDLFGIVGFGNFNQNFEYDGTNYLISIFLLGVGGPSPVATLLPGECSVLGLAAGCQGFRTAENAVTSAQFAFAVTTDRFPIGEIPEPGSLALLALGLVGLGACARKRFV